MDTRILVIGAGALGSHLVLLGRNWHARLVAIDFDRVEGKNTLSQFHSRMGLGRNKALALQQAMQGLFSVKIEAVPHRMTEDNAHTLMAEATLVVDCVDDSKTRRVIRSACETLGIPCLHGALAADGQYARVMWSEDFEVDDGGEGEATCEDGQHLPFIGIVSAYLASTVQNYLASGKRDSFHVRPDGITMIAST
jgi:molybdopterin/thiamine biosynthesis adenylyltransferase